MNKILVFLCCLTFASLSYAHGRWINPSHSIVSGSKPTSITVDMSISNDVFHPDHAYGGAPLVASKEKQSDHPLAKIARSTKLQVFMPDGSQSTDFPIVNLGRKSASSITLNQSGTYRIDVIQDPIFYTRYKDNQNEFGRVFGIDKTSTEKLPIGVRDIAAVKTLNRVQTYVTRNQSTNTASMPVDKGLSLKFETHPNDLFANEKLEVALFLDAKPLASSEIKITQGNTRYRNDRNTITVETNKKGEAVIQWQGAGMYVLEVEHERAVDHAEHSVLVNALYLTLEVFPE